MQVHITATSSNVKTGPIPVSTTSKESCPENCGQRDECYAASGPLAIHWAAVTAGTRGMDWLSFCDVINALPGDQLWRHNQAGDLPPDASGKTVDPVKLGQLVRANIGHRGFTYTHWKDEQSIDWIRHANAWGFTINLSADTIKEADQLHATGCPVVVVVPSHVTANFKTPAGNQVVICPHATHENVSCVDCQLCQRQRTSIVAFPAHGSKYRRIDIRLAA